MPSCSSQQMRKPRAETPSDVQIAGTAEIPLRLSFQQSLEADREILVLTRGGRNLDRGAFREGLDQGIDQLLLQPVGRFGTDERWRPTFDRADGSRMEVPQTPPRCWPQQQPSSGRRDGEDGPGQCSAITNQLRGRHPYRAPAAGRVGSRVQALAGAQGHDVAGSHTDPAPDRGRSIAEWHHNQDHVGRHGDERDPRQVFLGSRQPQAVQGDLGQPCAKCARSGDEKAKAAFLAQHGLEILRFAEDRGNATRHFSFTGVARRRAR